MSKVGDVLTPEQVTVIRMAAISQAHDHRDNTKEIGWSCPCPECVQASHIMDLCDTVDALREQLRKAQASAKEWREIWRAVGA